MFKLAKLDKIFSILLFAAVPIGLYFAFFYAPVERIMGIVQKIFYFHVASAWIGFAAFFVTFVASILYLITKKYTFDDIAAASAEIGLAFCTIVILTGPLWAKPAWGKFWTWDPRLTSTLLLWFIYVGYIMLRHTGCCIAGIISYSRHAAFVCLFTWAVDSFSCGSISSK